MSVVASCTDWLQYVGCCELHGHHVGQARRSLSFIRSKMELGSMEYIAAAPTHLAKLDRVQRAAEKLCGCTFQTLKDRREVAVFSLVCKLLDGECV